MGVGGQRHAPAALPPRKTRYPLYRWPVAPQGRYRRVRKVSSPTPGFNPRTDQPVASRYNDWATPVHLEQEYNFDYNVHKSLYSINTT